MSQKKDNMFRPFIIRPSSGLTWRTKEESQCYMVNKLSSLGLRTFGWGLDWREQSLGGSSPLCVNYSITIDEVVKSKHNKTLLRYKESKERQHVSALFIVRPSSGLTC